MRTGSLRELRGLLLTHESILYRYYFTGLGFISGNPLTSYRFCLYWPLFRSIIEASRLLQIPRFRRNLPGLGEVSMPFPISSVSDGHSPNRVAALASNRKFHKARPPMVVQATDLMCISLPKREEGLHVSTSSRIAERSGG